MDSRAAAEGGPYIAFVGAALRCGPMWAQEIPFPWSADRATSQAPNSRRGRTRCVRDRPDREGICPVYKLLLCLRYLQTRYLAFICIVSVMLGVATLIVVNAVMSGFSTKLKDRLHGVLSDIVIDTDRIEGMFVFAKNAEDDRRPLLTADQICKMIEDSPAGDRIEAVSPTIEVFAILQFPFRGQTQTKPVRLIGIDPVRRAAVGGFSEYLVRQRGLPNPSFDLSPDALLQHDWNKRRQQREDELMNQPEPPGVIRIPDPNAPAPIPAPRMDLDKGMPEAKLSGVIPGYTLAHLRYRNLAGDVMEEVALSPGDAVTITTIGGANIRPVWGSFLVTDYIKTEMSEYDQSFVYVPLDQLQKIRGMDGRCTAIQIRLKNYDQDKAFVTAELKKLFGESDIRIATWEENQGPLLAAIDVERGILNLLLFMIVGVAGFSILAIFTMIVSEKYRDIGILKSLGASSGGVMSIFLGYGLLLGTVGCGFGTVLGLWITYRINTIEKFLTEVTGVAVFPRDVYYFKDIPTNIDPMNVLLVNLGAIAIATVFSILPSYRAARLHPVRALRFE